MNITQGKLHEALHYNVYIIINRLQANVFTKANII